MIWKAFEVLPMPAGNRGWTIDFRMLLRIVFYVLLNLFACQSLGIEAAARRHGRSAYERFLIIDKVKA